MIEQLIRKYINNNIRRLSESLTEANDDITVDTASGWKFIIPSARSLRGQKATNIAKKNGAIDGLMVIARKSKKTTTDDSKLISDIKKLFDEAIIPGKYDPIKTLFVYMQVLNKPNKKVWNIWVIDKKRSGINSAVQELLKQQEKIYQRTDISNKIITANKIDEIDKITFMSYDMANNWFNLLKKSNLSTTLNLPNLIDIKQLQDSSDDTDIKESQIVYLWRSSEFEGGGGNRYIVYRTNNGILAGFEDDQILYKDIKILLSGHFQGKALMQITPDGLDYSFTPLEGTIKTGAYKLGNASGEIVFDGKFINGLPAAGTAEIKGLGADNSGIFTGQVKPTVNADMLMQSLGLDNGTMEYNNGLTFKGKFEKNLPSEGTLYNKQKQIIGQYVNGRLKSTSELKFPYTWNSKDYGNITVYKQGNNVYVRIPSINGWGETTQDNFQENSFDGSVKDIFTITQDPVKVAQLNKDILKIEPEIPPIPSPTPTPVVPKKKKYIVLTGNTINVYTYNGNEFVINTRNSSTTNKDRTTGYPLTSTKSAKIKNGDGRTYKMYKIKDNGLIYYLPESGVKIVER